MLPIKQSRQKLIEALAYCVEVLAHQALMEGPGAINSAMKTDERIWDHLDNRTIDILTNGLGFKRPKL